MAGKIYGEDTFVLIIPGIPSWPLLFVIQPRLVPSCTSRPAAAAATADSRSTDSGGTLANIPSRVGNTSLSSAKKLFHFLYRYTSGFLSCAVAKTVPNRQTLVVRQPPVLSWLDTAPGGRNVGTYCCCGSGVRLCLGRVRRVWSLAANRWCDI